MKFKDIFTSDWKVNWPKLEQMHEFQRLKAAKQSSIWHKEGDALVHTKMVAEQMEKLLAHRHFEVGCERWIMLMAAAVCHDLGKGTNTKWDKDKNDWSANNHGQASAWITRTMFYDEDFNLREKVCFICRWHMTLHHIFDKPERTTRGLLKLYYGPVRLDDMILMKEADSLGSINDTDTLEQVRSTTEKIIDEATKLNLMGTNYPYAGFKNSWHKMEFFAHPEKYNTPEDVADADSGWKSEFTVTVMVGIPGSGKDYYIEHSGLKNWPVLCRDNIRQEIGLQGEKPQGNKQQEEEVTKIFNERMFSYLKNKQSFVVNNTNTNMRWRSELVRQLLPYHPNINFVYCESPDLHFNKERRKGMMPDTVIDRFWKEMEFPSPTECSEIFYEVERPEFL